MSSAQPHNHNTSGGSRPRRSPFEVASVSFRDYFQLQLDLMEERCLARYADQLRNVDQRMLAMQTAIDKAEIALNTRLEAMNEIRSQLATQRADFVTLDRLDSLLTPITSDRKALIDKVDQFAAQNAAQTNLTREQHVKDLDTLRERMEQGLRTANTDIRTLRESRSQQTGSQITSREYVSYGILILAIVATLLSRFLP